MNSDIWAMIQRELGANQAKTGERWFYHCEHFPRLRQCFKHPKSYKKSAIFVHILISPVACVASH